MVKLVRVRGNSVFYEHTQSRGRKVNGERPSQTWRLLGTLHAPSRPADRCESFLLGQQTVVLTAWHSSCPSRNYPNWWGWCCVFNFCVPMGLRVLHLSDVVVLDRFRNGGAQ